MRHSIRRSLVGFGLAAVLTTGVLSATGGVAYGREGGFNDEYVYATTRTVSRIHANPGLKVTLYPLALAVDTAFLPLAVIAGFVTG